MFFLPQYLCLLLLHFLILWHVYLTTNFFHLKIFWDKLVSGNTRMINSEKSLLPSKPFRICLVSLKQIKQNLHNAVPCSLCKVNTVGSHEELQLLEFNPWALVVWGFELLFGKREERLIFSENGQEYTHNFHQAQNERRTNTDKREGHWRTLWESGGTEKGYGCVQRLRHN